MDKGEVMTQAEKKAYREMCWLASGYIVQRELMDQLEDARKQMAEAMANLSDCVFATYPVGAVVFYDTYSTSIRATVVAHGTFLGRIKIRNLVTLKERWVDGETTALRLAR